MDYEQTAAIFLMVTCLIIAVLLIFKYVDRLAPYKKYIDLFLFLYAVESMVRHYIMWTIRDQPFNYIPFQICYFTSFIYMYYYFSKNRKMLPFLHIFGFLGVGALIAPGHDFSFTNILSYIFMIDHIVLGVMPFYIIVVHKYYPEYKTIKYILLTLVPFFIISIPLSYWLGANYFFLMTNPITGDTLSPWIVLIVQLALMYPFAAFATFLGQKIVGKPKEKTA